MRAVIITRKGGPEVLEVREVPDPVPGPEEILVEVVSTSVNRADLLQTSGVISQPAARGLGYPRSGIRRQGAGCGLKRTALF